MSAFELDLPRKAREILVPTHTPTGERVRYRGLYGGRDGAKSHSFARMALTRGLSRPERILCTREIQKSIADSVHRLLSDLIPVLGLEYFYDIQKQYILGKNGTIFNFHGLSGETVMSLKSYEGTTICWIEEAQTISKRSLSILEPTIRAPNSELWISFNPELDTDEVYKFLVTKPPPDALVNKIGWEDNPWRSQVLDAARDRMRRDAPEDYAFIYGGHCRPSVEGAIYAKEIRESIEGRRSRPMPYDPTLKVHTIWDLGYIGMSVIMAQKVGNSIMVIDYLEADQTTYAEIVNGSERIQGLSQRGYKFGTHFLPHDAKAHNPQTGKSAYETVEKLLGSVDLVPDIGVEEGIRAAKQMFHQVYFDDTKAELLLHHLKRYRRRINNQTEAQERPLHDEHSHGSDAFRCMAVIAESMRNDELGKFDPLAGWH